MAEPVDLPDADVPAWLVAPQTSAARDVASDVALVLDSGAGPADRDTLLGAARAPAACGVTAVTYDKGGPATLLRRDFPAWAQVTSGVVQATRAATRADRVGVAAWSEGCWVAARMLKDVDLLISLGAPVVTPAEQLAWQADRPLAGCRTPFAASLRPSSPTPPRRPGPARTLVRSSPLARRHCWGYWARRTGSSPSPRPWDGSATARRRPPSCSSARGTTA